MKGTEKNSAYDSMKITMYLRALRGKNIYTMSTQRITVNYENS